MKKFMPHPANVASMLSIEKAKALNLREGEIALTADTIVVIDNRVLGKPKDKSEARRFLNLLSGNKHDVITAITLKHEIAYGAPSKSGHSKSALVTDFEITKVSFSKMSRDDINWYVESREPFGKAGGYAIQGLGGMFIKSIKGCYFNVVGLPVFCMFGLMKRLELDYRDYLIYGRRGE